MTFIKKHLGVCVLFLLFTLGATKAQAQFGVYFTNNVIPAEQKDGYTEPALQGGFYHDQGFYEIMEGSNYFSLSDSPSSIAIQFWNYSGYYWYYGNQGVGGYINLKVYDYNDEIIYDETQYIGPYDWTYGAGLASFTGVPTSGDIEITTSTTN